MRGMPYSEADRYERDGRVGLAESSEEGMVKFLETGKNPRGDKADPPMPAYTLSHDDAVAVMTCLKSLK